VAREVRVVLVGLGNLGRRFCRILADKAGFVEEQYHLRLLLVVASHKTSASQALTSSRALPGDPTPG